MPTGYTYPIEEGCSFEEFAWGCARAFGALIMMRDDPMDSPIPDEFQPSDYHLKAISEAEAEINRLSGMEPRQIDAEMAKERAEVVAYNAESIERNRRESALYGAMLDKVNAWVAPSPDHVGMKEFMVQQITISLPGEPCLTDMPPSDPKEWLRGKYESARESLAYHLKEHAAELDRTAARNLWIRRLRESIPQPNHPDVRP